MTLEEEIHFDAVRDAILDGDLVPFLGAGANLCGRPTEQSWKQGEYLPSGGELAEQIAERFGYRWGNRKDLLRVAQFVATVRGMRPLFRDLHTCFDADYPATALHRFLAQLPAVLRAKGHSAPPLLIVTTNYDDVLERAFLAAGEPCDIVAYLCEGREAGRFVHQSAGGERHLIERPNEYCGILLKERPVVLKLHGSVERLAGVSAGASPGATDDESFVITEDHYIDYLARAGINELIPADLLGKLSTSSILFLGYSLSDWNLRIILQRIWLDRKLSSNCWAVNANVEYLEKETWKRRGVGILKMRLEEYFDHLSASLEALPEIDGQTSVPGC